MNSSGAVEKSAAVVFRDGLGERRRIIDSTGADADVLGLAPDLAGAPGFEQAVRKNASRLAAFHHPAFGELRSVERLNGTLAIIAGAAQGIRLSDLIASGRGAIDLPASLCIVRQAIAAVEALHGYDREIAHGAIGPERLVITPRGRVVVTDYVLGAALEHLRFSHQTYWKNLRVPLPRSVGLTKFDQRVDITQIGVIALTLFLGRALRDDEYSAKLVDVAASFQTMGVTGDHEPLSPALASWLSRALQHDAQRSFSSASEARIELESLLSDDVRDAGVGSLERVLSAHGIVPEPPLIHSGRAPQPLRSPEPVRPVEPARTPEPVVAAAPVIAPPIQPAPVQPPPTPLTATPVLMPLAARIDPPAASPAPTFISAPPPPSRPQSSSSWSRLAVAMVVIAMLTTVGLYALRRRASAGGVNAALGTLSVQSNPSGVPIDIDGKASGVTPATLSLEAGQHTLLLRPDGEPRKMTVNVTAGAQVSQYIELAKTLPTTGGLLVRTEPAGATVTIDRVPQGASPVSVANLTPGDHSVVVSADGVSVEQIVSVEAGMTSSLVVPISARDRGPVSGWIAVTAPIDVQIYESGRLLGSNQTDRIMVPAGEHHLDLVNDALGYRFSKAVNVAPGKVESMSLKMPTGSVAVNAVPWAEVWLDGEKAGDTPIGNLQTTIGRHEVVFRNPQFGESRQTVTVTATAPARLSVDMRKK